MEPRRKNILIWVFQALLAVFVAMQGVMKLAWR